MWLWRLGHKKKKNIPFSFSLFSLPLGNPLPSHEETQTVWKGPRDKEINLLSKACQQPCKEAIFESEISARSSLQMTSALANMLSVTSK